MNSAKVSGSILKELLTTYQIQVVDGNKPCNATVSAYSYTPNGTRYAVCTTIQFGYKPAANCSLLTVEPQATQVTTPTKTPEQMQAEAEQGGWLTFWHEWSWWYPWYRLHFVCKFNGEEVLDVGPALLGYDFVDPRPKFDSWIDDFANAILKAYFYGWIAAEIAVQAAMQFGLPVFVVAFLASIALKGGLLASAWNSIQDLKSAFIGAWASLIIGMVGVVKMLHSGIVSLAFGFLETASKLDFWKFIYKFAYVPINIIFLMLIINRLAQLGGL